MEAFGIWIVYSGEEKRGEEVGSGGVVQVTLRLEPSLNLGFHYSFLRGRTRSVSLAEGHVPKRNAWFTCCTRCSLHQVGRDRRARRAMQHEAWPRNREALESRSVWGKHSTEPLQCPRPTVHDCSWTGQWSPSFRTRAREIDSSVTW